MSASCSLAAQIWSPASFLSNLWTKNVFYITKRLEKKGKENYFMTHESQISVSVKSFSWNTAALVCLRCVCDWCREAAAELSSGNRDSSPQSLQYLLSCPYRETLPTPSLAKVHSLTKLPVLDSFFDCFTITREIALLQLTLSLHSLLQSPSQGCPLSN